MRDEGETVQRIKKILGQQFYMNSRAGIGHLYHRYGLTPLDVMKMLVNQEGFCDDCGGDLALLKKFCVDHNHQTQRVRGIICYRCNTAVRETELMKKHVAYLRKYGEII